MNRSFHRFARHAGAFFGPHAGRGHRPPLDDAFSADPREQAEDPRQARFAELREFWAVRGRHGHHPHAPHERHDLHDDARFDLHGHDPRGGGRGGRGPGGPGGPRGGRGGDEFDGLRGRGRGGPRPLGHGDLRHLMLHLIAEQPRHGYELIRLIEELFHGAYSPSPGAIYPTLSQLEDMGLIAATAEEGRKRYAITEEGRAHMAQAHEEIEAARMRTHRSARDIAKAQIPPAVREAFSRIKHAVLARHGQWSEGEIARFADLLNQAADGLERDDAR